MAILEALCQRRHDTMGNLAHEFGVSRRTIRNDINVLSLSYPIITTRGNGGGVGVIDGYYLHRKYLNPKQLKFLEGLSIGLSGDDLDIMDSIFRDFTLNK